MDLFSAAGLDLPSDSRVKRRGAPPSPPRLPLFAAKVLDNAVALSEFAPTADQVAAAKAYARRAKNANFGRQKETKGARQLFYEMVLGRILGYALYDPDAPYTLITEQHIRGRAVDVAIGRFSEADGDVIAAPLEMKGPETRDLDAIMPGRGKSPVQQAWEYAVDAPGVKWVLVSNCVELRLYRFGRGRDAYELFDLTRLDEEAEHRRLWLLLDARRFLEGATETLLVESDTAYRDVTNDLYRDYKALRDRIIQFLMDSAEGPRLQRRQAVETAQKLLDRVLFIAFAVGTRLLPGNLLERAAKAQNEWDEPIPKWTNFQRLFRFVDAGRSRLDIFAYNGGLFRQDAAADTVMLPDALADEVVKLGAWDYGREVPVTVLGHMFEQSITDLEREHALARGEPEPAVSKKKREGVVYTPDHITRFLVEHTIGVTLAERLAALLKRHTGHSALPGKQEPSPWPDEESERAFWRDWLDALRQLTVLDPACGSGAFLVAAFDALAGEYRRVIERLDALGEPPSIDAYDEILTRNLHGVDLNVESVEITRLSLWLKTARRQRRLASLDETIRDGDSLIVDSAVSERAFAWDGRFADIRARGGFDVVIGNPPYVRMELIKPVKPYLAQHYAVADERADLYAYFFEKGLSLLKPGGRLGYISSSTFFRTGSGERLRALLAERTAVESVIDFGDVQVFEGVTTYPAILTARKLPAGEVAEGGLAFMNIRGDAPADLSAAFERDKRPMRRARLTSGSWRFEEEPLARLRDKIVGGRKTLREVYGAPLYGIKTGLNEAFVVDRATRNRLVARDPRSAELLKPFLRGEDIKRWRVEPEGLFLINIPKGAVDIERYPGIRDHLAAYRRESERRATEQEWFELQQAQVAYHGAMAGAKIAWPHFQHAPAFTLDRSGAFLNNKCFFFPSEDPVLVAYLNTQVAWLQVLGVSRLKRGGYIEAEAQYIETLAAPTLVRHQRARLAALGETCTEKAGARFALVAEVRARIATDLRGAGARKLSRKLENWHGLDFAAFRREVKRVLRADIPVKERSAWERYLAENAANVHALTAEIAAAEQEIDALVYEAFDLTAEEIALVEASIAGQA